MTLSAKTADFGNVPGNDALKRRLIDDIKSDRLGHAYIFEGDRGIGKRALAMATAKAVLCHDRDADGEHAGADAIPCGRCGSCRRFDAGSHPDVSTVGRNGKATIGVDAIRSLRADTHIIPSESRRKVYIIEDADTMTTAAQNALLLSLEEPPEYVLYLLLCEDSKSLLETIRSRAVTYRMQPCNRQQLEEYLLRTGGAKASTLRGKRELWEELIVEAGGNAGVAEGLLDEKLLTALIARKREALALISAMMARDEGITVTLSSQSIRKMKREDAIELLELCETAVRDMICSKKSRSFELCFFTSVDEAARSSEQFTMRTLAMTAAELRATRDEIESNMSVPTSFLSLAVRLGSL